MTLDRRSFFDRVVSLMPNRAATADDAARLATRFFGPGAPIVTVPRTLTRVCNERRPRCRACPLVYRCASAEQRIERGGGPSFVDLFSGAGGLSLGFEQAGYEGVAALDHDAFALATYSLNRAGRKTETIAGDVRDEMPRLRAFAGIDVLLASPPCQTYSNANRQRRARDPRAELWRSILAAEAILKPRAVIVENVPGFRTVAGALARELSERGYATEVVILDGLGLGLPQSRKRVILVALRGGRRALRATAVRQALLSRPARTHSLFDAIGDLPALSASTRRNSPDFESPESGYAISLRPRSGSRYVRAINAGAGPLLFNHKARYNCERDIEIFRRLKPGCDSRDPAIAEIMPYGDRSGIFFDKYYRLRYDRPSRAVTAHMRFDCNMYIHPEQARGLTVREAARLQGFPDDYVFVGTFQRLYQQVGNAVPPIMSNAIAKSLLEHIA